MTIDPEYKQKQLAAMSLLESHAGLGSAVPMTEDFANDNRICLTAVAFLPDDLQAEIEANIVDKLRILEPQHYYYMACSYHVTVQNVRTISDPPTFDEREIRTAIKVLQEQFKNAPPLHFEICSLLSLPTSMALRAFAQPFLLELTRRTRDALSQAGLPDNKEYVSDDVVFGNITLCRYSSPPSRALLERAKEVLSCFSRTVHFRQVKLITTNAVCHPGRTRTLATFDLCGG